MESSCRALTFAIIIAAVALTGCVTEKEITSNPGYDEVNEVINETVNVQEVVSDTPSSWQDKGKTFGKTLLQIFNEMVKGLFGEKGWYYVAAAVLIIIVILIWQRVGLLLLFLFLMYLFVRVIGK